MRARVRRLAAAFACRTKAIKGWTVECVIKNPVVTAVVVVGVVMAAAPGLVASPVLSAIGFTADGVAAGSVAAAIQAGIGNVLAGSIFSTLQSVAAGGAGTVLIHAAVKVAGIAVAAAALWFWKRSNK